MEHVETVICANCQKTFSTVYSEIQAVGCASDYIAEQKAIFCHYGSGHDTSKFNVVAGDFVEGIICDECIDTAIENKQIVIDETFDYWEPVRKLQEQQAKLYHDVNWKVVDYL